jgi:hypothetical protein
MQRALWWLLCRLHTPGKNKTFPSQLVNGHLALDQNSRFVFFMACCIILHIRTTPSPVPVAISHRPIYKRVK